MTQQIYNKLTNEELNAIDNKNVFKLNDLIEKRNVELLRNQFEKIENNETENIFEEKKIINALKKMAISIETDLMAKN